MTIHWMSADGGLQQAHLAGGPIPLKLAGAWPKVGGALSSLVSKAANVILGGMDSLSTIQLRWIPKSAGEDLEQKVHHDPLPNICEETKSTEEPQKDVIRSVTERLSCEDKEERIDKPVVPGNTLLINIPQESRSIPFSQACCEAKEADDFNRIQSRLEKDQALLKQVLPSDLEKLIDRLQATGGYEKLIAIVADHILACESSPRNGEFLKRWDAFLVKRLLHETQGSHARSVTEWSEVDHHGIAPYARAFTNRENLREFSTSHPELQEKLTPILQAMDTVYDITEATAIHNALKNALALPRFKNSSAQNIYNAHLEKFARFFNIKLQSIRPGESLGVPSGPSGHSVFLEIRKTTDSTCTCLLYNTGGGVGEHTPSRLDNEKYHPLVWTDIPLPLLKDDFFQKIISRGELSNMKEYLGQFRSVLGKENEQAALAERAYRGQGELGSCATKSSSVWLRNAMNVVDPSGELYRQFKHETTEKLIKTFDERFPAVRDEQPGDDLNQKPKDSRLSLGLLREIRKRAGEVQERRALRDQFPDMCKQAKAPKS